MATTGDAPPSNLEAFRGQIASRPQRGNQSGRGRWSGRVEGHMIDRNQHQHENHDSRRGRQGRRGQRGGNIGNVAINPSDPGSQFSELSISDLQLNAKSLANSAGELQATPEGVEAEVCFICASPVVHYAVAPCNHRTCHICTLRMRALYKTKYCAHCRTESQYVIFTDETDKRYEDFIPADLASTDENIGIKYEKTEIVEDTLLLLRYNCPDLCCDVACLGWPDLHRHVRRIHHRKMCDLCSRHKKVFTHEQELFTEKGLELHIRRGDDRPGAVDQSGFKGHPLCSFCGERFYGDDELYIHCREKHERCFLCERRDGGGQPQYYLNMDALWDHFRKEHFPCPEPECMEQKVIVFPSEMDLKAHLLEVHGNKLSKDVRRDTRVVDISSFDYREPYVQERRATSQREGRGRGRGRDPTAGPLPISTAQPLRRDEQAFQRQMAIQSAQSVTTRTFGGQLTAISSSAARPPGSQETLNRAAPRLPSPIESANSHPTPTEPGNLVDLAPQEQARRLRHSAVIERAGNLLRNDQLKLNQFRNVISSFRTSKVSASGLICAFFALFDASSAALGTLIREVADLYEDQSKAESLHKAWNDWRAINEDYPSLPGPSGMSESSLTLGWAQVTASTPSSNPTPPKSTSRVLKLKSSTAQSSRSSASQSASWGTASTQAAAYPSGSTAPSANYASLADRIETNTGSSLSAKKTYPSSSAVSSTAPSYLTPPTSRPSSRGPQRNITGSDAFPALPPAPKPTSTIFGYGTGAVRRNPGGSSNFSWGDGNRNSNGRGPDSAEGSAAQSDNDGAAAHGGKKKGNKGKKQVLVQWG